MWEEPRDPLRLTILIELARPNRVVFGGTLTNPQIAQIFADS